MHVKHVTHKLPNANRISFPLPASCHGYGGNICFLRLLVRDEISVNRKQHITAVIKVRHASRM